MYNNCSFYWFLGENSMPQDFFTLNRYIPSLKNKLVGSKVNKITQPTNDDIFLTLYKGEVITINVSANATLCHISISNNDYENPIVATNFCMLLRKHLLSSKITNVSLVNEDRIIKIDFSTENDFSLIDNVSLYLEIMGKYSNVFLVIENKIIGSLKNIPVSLDGKRISLYGANYTLPEKQDKLSPYVLNNIESALKDYNSLLNKQDLASYIYKTFIGFSKQTAEEIAYRIGENTLENAIRIFNDFINEKDNPVIIKSQHLYDFFPFDYTHLEGERIYFNSLLSAQSEYYENVAKDKRFSNLLTTLNAKIHAYENKLLKKLSILEDKKRQSLDYEKNKIVGQLILDNVYLIKKGDKKITVINYYEEDAKSIEISLDENLTPAQNAQKHFKKYSKQKKSLEYLLPQINEIASELDYAQNVKNCLKNSKTLNDLIEIEEELIFEKIITPNKTVLKKNSKKKQFNYRRYEVDGYTILCGKNNIQNDALTFSSDKFDLWLHVKNYHSSHTIIKNKGQDIPDKIIQIASSICAYYSTCKNSDKIAVDYTLKKYVKKQPNSKLGSVIYTDYKTILVNPNSYEEFLKN